MAPKHLSNVPEDRKAIAPYNFVEIPNQLVQAQALPTHDFYDIQRRTGRIECVLETSSPLYTRCGLTPVQFAIFGDTPNDKLTSQQRHEKANFFQNPASSRPALPGSSLRGMLRTLVEIISYSKLDMVTDSELIYRAVGDTTSLGDKYRDRLLDEHGSKTYSFRMKAGYLRQQKTGNWVIRPAQEIAVGASFARIEEQDIKKARNLESWHNIRNAHKINVTLLPLRIYPHNKDKQGNPRVKLEYVKAQLSQSDTAQPGVLVKTGWAPRKHMEFIFGLPSENPQVEIPIADELILSYKEQITEGQKKILGDQGALRPMQPIFYVMEDNKLVFFGHAMMFRIPYLTSVKKFIPDNLQNLPDTKTTDLAEAIFGYVKRQKGTQDQVCRGRVAVSDGICLTTEQPVWLMGDDTTTLTPKILTSPKPTTFQHYLVQKTSEPKQLKHYASQPLQDTVLRGHKLYWHKKVTTLDGICEKQNKIVKSPSQYTEIKPIRSGVRFQFTIHFENLSDEELGALLWVLNLAQDDRYRLSLGMGKPLGMGAIKIAHQLVLSKRQQRYSKLFENDNWALTESLSEDTSTYTQAFENFILDKIDPGKKSFQKLQDVRRIKMLLAMLSWDEAPPPEKTRYMEIECDPTETACILEPKQGKTTANEYSERRVLPDPLQIMLDKSNGTSSQGAEPKKSGGSERPRLKSEKSPDRTKHDERRKGSDGGGGTSLALQRAPKPPKR